ncbi:MAG: peptidase and chymotrypsin/Hap, partial [Acidobacteria bacterium]|nr:peptidase and chymotrypsin/Hap [Acidobacteriota bacterium]
TWVDVGGVRGTIVATPTGLSTTWSDATGQHSAIGMIVERDGSGRPTKIAWSNGVVMQRATQAPPLATVAPQAAPAQPPFDLAGTWSSNVGVTYTITQVGTQIVWTDIGGVRGTITGTAAGLSTTWTDATGPHTATSLSVEKDAAGRPVRIAWSNGVVMQRAAQAAPQIVQKTPAPFVVPTAPAVPPATPTGPAPIAVQAGPVAFLDFAGTWSSNIGLTYTITQVGTEVVWVDGVGGRGTITPTATGLSTTWTDATGPHTATSLAFEKDAAGRPVRIAWSNGVVIQRAAQAAPSQAPTPTAQLGALPHIGRVATVVAPGAVPGTWLVNTELGGASYNEFALPDTDPIPQACEAACRFDLRCQAWTYVLPGVQDSRAHCRLKAAMAPTVPNESCISGMLERNRAAAVSKELSVPSVLPTPMELRQRLVQFDQTWHAAVDTQLSNGPTRVQQAQVMLLQAQAARAQAATIKAPGAGVPPQIAGMTVLLQIDRVVPLVTDPGLRQMPGIVGNLNVVDGRYVLVYGKNFGTCSKNCGVYLEYKEAAGEVFTPGYAPATHAVELTPPLGSWVGAWHDQVIVARMPVLPGQSAGAQAKLLVHRGESPPAVTSQAVSLKLAGPSLAYIDVVPAYSDFRLTAGGEIWVHGAGFGNAPGQIWIEVPGLVVQALLPRVMTWRDDLIRATIDKIPGLSDVRPAVLHVRSGNPPRDALVATRLGPRMQLTQISGKDFLEFTKADPADKVEEHSGILLATHDPGSSSCIQGNHGEDWFFRAYPLPPGVEIAALYIQQIRPDDTQKSLEYLVSELKSWLNALLDGPQAVLKKWAEYAITAIVSAFNPDIGSYRMNVIKSPTPGNPSLGIHWENTCWGPYDEVPLKYTTTFFLWGPEDIVPGTPMKSITPSSAP